jgi:hypothetical protein
VAAGWAILFGAVSCAAIHVLGTHWLSDTDFGAGVWTRWLFECARVVGVVLFVVGVWLLAEKPRPER